MCLSTPIRNPEVEDSRPKSAEFEKTTAKMKECPEPYIPCNSTVMHCSGYGQCCYKNDDKMFCWCEKGRGGKFCESRSYRYNGHYRAELLGTQTVAVFSAFLGVAVITLFFVAIVLQIRFDRKHKKHRHTLTDDDRELNEISKPDASDRGSKKVLITQPGYSWRESVRRTGSKAAHKFRNTMSRSVPDDLFGVGLKLAIFGGFKPTDQQSTVGKEEFKALTTDRCFSAGPELGDRQVICDQKDNANAKASKQPIPAQIPAATAAATATGEAATEDTVM